MKILFIMLFSSVVYGASAPSLPECITKVHPDNSVTLDCILAEVSLHEIMTEQNRNWLGIGSYTAFMRFYIRNPSLFSQIVIYKPIVGAVEECSIRNLFNFTSALLVMQSPSPYPGGTHLKARMTDCLRSILSDRLLDALIDDMDFLVTRKSFSKRTLIR